MVDIHALDLVDRMMHVERRRNPAVVENGLQFLQALVLRRRRGTGRRRMDRDDQRERRHLQKCCGYLVGAHGVLLCGARRSMVKKNQTALGAAVMHLTRRCASTTIK